MAQPLERAFLHFIDEAVRAFVFDNSRAEALFDAKVDSLEFDLVTERE